MPNNSACLRCIKSFGTILAVPRKAIILGMSSLECVQPMKMTWRCMHHGGQQAPFFRQLRRLADGTSASRHTTKSHTHSFRCSEIAKHGELSRLTVHVRLPLAVTGLRRMLAYALRRKAILGRFVRAAPFFRRSVGADFWRPVLPGSPTRAKKPGQLASTTGTVMWRRM